MTIGEKKIAPIGTRMGSLVAPSVAKKYVCTSVAIMIHARSTCTILYSHDKTFELLIITFKA